MQEQPPMQEQPTSEFASGPSQPVDSAHVEELRQRIETLEALDDSGFGEFTRTDWVICTLGAVIVPALVLLWIGR